MSHPMKQRDSLWQVVRPLVVGLLSEIRQRPWLHRPMHAMAVKASGHPVASKLIQAVLEEHYLTAYEYDSWILANDTLSEADRTAIARHIADMPTPPTISVVMPVYNTDEGFLRQAIQSVRAQLYPHWELCIADDASPGEATWAALQAAAALDPRIKLMRRRTNGHISAASNSALELATGDYVALMDHDDLLSERALYEVAAELESHPDAQLIYSDEDKMDEQNRRFDPHFKTGWNPELLLGQNLVGHLCMYGGTYCGRSGASEKDSKAARTMIWPCGSPSGLTPLTFATCRWCSIIGASAPALSLFPSWNWPDARRRHDAR